MAVLGSDIISRVRTQLIDPAGVRWTDVELLQWLSDGQRTIVALDPSAAPNSATVPLVAGTKQSLPAGGYMLLSVIRNIAVGGAPGRATRIVTREAMDAFNPSWHTDASSGVVKHYLYDPENSGVWYCYPPNDGTGQVEMLYGLYPVDVTSLSSPLTVQPIYETPLVDYVLFRANQKDSDFAAGQQAAQMYLAAFMAFMGQDEDAQLKQSPNLQLTPFSPEIKGAAK
jgi:hypothetical protein